MKESFGKQKRFQGMLSGVITVEMTYIMSVILLVFFLCMLGIFYYHDKEIIASCAYEAVTVAGTKSREKEEVTEDLVQAIFQERVCGKCILFADVDAQVTVSGDEITLAASARKRKMSVKVSEAAKLTDPEKKIRTRRKILGYGTKNRTKEGSEQSDASDQI